MSQQHTTQASGQGMLERVFKLREHGTTARTEVIAGLVTLRSCISSCRQSSRLRSSVVMDFFMSGNRASRRDEHNQQQAYYATGNQNPDQHIPCADTNHRRQPNPQ